MKISDVKKILQKTKNLFYVGKDQVYNDVSSLHVAQNDIISSISSLKVQRSEVDDKIFELIQMEDEMLFNGNFFQPLKMLDWSYFHGGSKFHRGGWHALLEYLQCKNYLTADKGILFADILEQYFVWDYGKALEQDWIGISHMTPNTSEIHKLADVNLLFSNQNFQNSLKYCRGLIFLSDYMKAYADQYFNHSLPTFSLKHPVSDDIQEFNFDDFKNHPSKRVILLGKQMRRISSIYLLNTRFPKAWMPGTSAKKFAFNLVKSEMDMIGLKAYKHFNPRLVEFLHYPSFQKYDEVLRTNIILLDLYDASANNSILELLQGNIPFFCRRLPAAEQYLGKGYPMFYNNLDYVHEILKKDEYILNLYKKTNQYMKNLNKDDLRYEFFARKLLRVFQ